MSVPKVIEWYGTLSPKENCSIWLAMIGTDGLYAVYPLKTVKQVDFTHRSMLLQVAPF